MSNSEYTEVRSHHYPDGDTPDLIFEAYGIEDKEWIYAFYENPENLPNYMKTHSERNNQASEVEDEARLSRITDEHLGKDTDIE